MSLIHMVMLEPQLACHTEPAGELEGGLPMAILSLPSASEVSVRRHAGTWGESFIDSAVTTLQHYRPFTQVQDRWPWNFPQSGELGGANSHVLIAHYE